MNYFPINPKTTTKQQRVTANKPRREIKSHKKHPTNPKKAEKDVKRNKY